MKYKKLPNENQPSPKARRGYLYPSRAWPCGLLFLHQSSANSWQWDLYSSGSGNTLHWQWELILLVGTLSWQWECLVHFIPNKYCLSVGISVGITVGIVAGVTGGCIDDERSCCGDGCALGEGV
nr:hypothetical protein [Tanacetum cinerariifolium]